VRLLNTGHGQPAVKSIISGPLDADKQDYLLRDSLFCGVPYGVFDIHQMHRSLTLRGEDDNKELMIDPNGIHAVEQYVMAKYYLTTNVYRHKVRLITDQMIVRAIVLGIEKDKTKELAQIYRFDNTDAFVSRYMSWDDARFMQAFCQSRPKTKCGQLLERLRTRRLLKMVFRTRLQELPAAVRDLLPSLMQPEPDFRRKRTYLEQLLAEKIARATGQTLDSDFVIVNIFNIRNVREMSRNDEAGILVGSDPPKQFESASTLFASINKKLADWFVEVYAPVEWATPTDKLKVKQTIEQPVLKLLERIRTRGAKT
jgi:HD superfamily phosphohydrolase